MNDSPAPEQLARALLTYLAELLQQPGLAYAEAPARIAQGLQSYVYGFKLRGRDLPGPWAGPLVFRVSQRAPGPNVQRDAEVQRFVAGLGYPAPQALAVQPAGGPLETSLMVMERLAGAPLSRRIVRKNLSAVRRLASRFADTHVQLHRLRSDGWPSSSAEPAVERQLARFRALPSRPSEIAELLNWLEDKRGLVEREERSVCHNNFHPANILLDRDGRMSVLDWSNADVGDRHQDVAATFVLLRTAPRRRANPQNRLLEPLCRSVFTRTYFSAYRGMLPIEMGRLHYWEVLRALEYWFALASYGLNEAWRGDLLRYARKRQRMISP